MSDLLERLRAALKDRYVIESEIGRGGMAIVYLASDLRHERQVAIKVLHPELSATVGAERFLQEIRTVARLNHPHILAVHESGEDDGLLYYVMPYVEGESLRQRLDQKRQLSIEETVRVGVEVADALDYAHRQGIIHRDIKPGNILLSEGHAVLADFGIARAVSVAKDERVTQTGLGLGTPLYVSPEQATADESLDGRTDIYSLGVVLYEMLAGEVPLSGSTPQSIQAKRLSQTPTPLPVLRDTVPPLLDSVIAKALAKVPADRFETAKELGNALMVATMEATPVASLDLSTTPSLVATSGQAAGRKRLILIASGLVIATALVAFGSWWADQQGKEGGGDPVDPNTSQRLTSFGRVGTAALSPDGDRLAFSVVNEGGSASLWVVSTSDSTDKRNLAAAEVITSIRWDRSGDDLYFSGRARAEWGYFRLSSTGSELDRVGPSWATGAFDISPDGERMAVIQSHFEVHRVWTGSPDAEHPSRFTQVYLASAPENLSDVEWSPSGESLAIAVSGTRGTIRILDLASDSERTVVSEPAVTDVEWGETDETLYYARRVSASRVGESQLMRLDLSTDGSEPIPVKYLGWGPGQFSLSHRSNRIAYIDAASRFEIVRVLPGRAGDTVQLRPVPHGEGLVTAFQTAPDGQWIAAAITREGGSDMYRIPVDGGGGAVPLTSRGDVLHGSVSPDGRYLAFAAADGDTMRLWIAPTSTGLAAKVAGTSVADTRLVGWAGSHPIYHHPDKTNFVVIDSLKYWKYSRQESIPLALAIPADFGVVEFKGIHSALLWDHWSGGDLESEWPVHMVWPAPSGNLAVARWSRPYWLGEDTVTNRMGTVSAAIPTKWVFDVPRWWLLSRADSTQMLLEDEAEFMGFADGESALLWLADNQLYKRGLPVPAAPDGLVRRLGQDPRSVADGDSTHVMELPEHIVACEQRPVARPAEYICARWEWNPDVWLGGHFDTVNY